MDWFGEFAEPVPVMEGVVVWVVGSEMATAGMGNEAAEHAETNAVIKRKRVYVRERGEVKREDQRGLKAQEVEAYR